MFFTLRADSFVLHFNLLNQVEEDQDQHKEGTKSKTEADEKTRPGPIVNEKAPLTPLAVH